MQFAQQTLLESTTILQYQLGRHSSLECLPQTVDKAPPVVLTPEALFLFWVQ